MPHVSVYVDTDSVLDELSDKELEQELANRRKDKVRQETAAITAAEAAITLDEAAHRFRQMERFDLAYKLDEIKHDYF